MNNSISNLISILKNATKNNKLNVVIHYNLFIYEIIKLLYSEGFIVSYKVINIKTDTYIFCILKKVNGNYLIRNIEIISKPSQRNYINIQKLKQYQLFNNGDTVLILSTPQGVNTGKFCVTNGISGELLFKIN